MELLFFMLPSFLHGWLMGDFSFSETDDERLRKPVNKGILIFNEGKIAEAFRFFCEEEKKGFLKEGLGLRKATLFSLDPFL